MLLPLVLNVFAAAATLAAPTVFLAGDSTMTAKGNNDGTAGWGVFLNNYTTLAIENDAVAGRSARSFTREGRFTVMAGTHIYSDLQAQKYGLTSLANVKSGDCVVIEFGHNDGGTLSSTSDNGRTDCSPVNNNYATTCSTTYK
jgi:rhamnogalacturonan acetylesterase